jgi:hypothetical protein
VDSVKSVLESGGSTLAAIQAQAARQQHWRRWLGERLTPALLASVTGVVERDAELVIFTASAAWAVRLRYVLAEHESALRAESELLKIRVRVLPPIRR